MMTVLVCAPKNEKLRAIPVTTFDVQLLWKRSNKNLCHYRFHKRAGIRRQTQGKVVTGHEVLTVRSLAGHKKEEYRAGICTNR